MDFAAIMDPARTARAHVPPQGTAARRVALWPSLIAEWTRHLDRQIENELRWMDRAGAEEDSRSASRD
jgi:hypothetical protein